MDSDRDTAEVTNGTHNGEHLASRLWLAAGVTVAACLLSLGSLAMHWITASTTYNSIIAQQDALLQAKADADELAEVRGLLEGKASKADFERLVGQLESKAPRATQDALVERTSNNTQAVRDIQRKVDEQWAYILTAWKSFQPPPQEDSQR